MSQLGCGKLSVPVLLRMEHLLCCTFGLPVLRGQLCQCHTSCSKSVPPNRSLEKGARTEVWWMCYSCFIVLQFVEIGIVTSIEINHKPVDVAKKGQEVCVKIEPIPGESPKMYGRHFEATDILVSKVRAICVCGEASGQSGSLPEVEM